MSEKLAILDCGGQYTKVIDRKVRELGVYTDIFPLGVDYERIKDYDAIILSGGPSSVWSNGAPEYSDKIFDLDKPMLGICYGMQLICEHFGGEVLPGVKTEYGKMNIKVDNSCPLFDSLSKNENVLMSHGDSVKRMPLGFECVATTGDVIAGVYCKEKNIVGVQFHPEVDLTENGKAILDNFLRKICKLKETYALEDRIQTSIDMIRKKVGNEKIMVLVSGGVDSAVTAALLVNALPAENVFAIHIDHGLMRKNESDIICDNLHELGLVNMKRMNAKEQFFNEKIDVGNGIILGPLSKTCDPEQKRQIIGSMFIKVTKDAADSLGLDFDKTFLAQGTLRPDLIESGNPDVSGYAHKIKTHHNDVDIVRKAREKGLIVETNWDWHKDEVRQVAKMLGLSEEIAQRQPFPGPGLGVRIICTDGEIAIDKNNSENLSEFVSNRNNDISVTIAPINSVGVQGDNRSYKNLAILFNRNNVEWNEIFDLSRDVPNNFNYINRVAICLNKKNLDGILKASPMHICDETTDLLREVDDIVTKNIMNSKIAQCFAVLIPVGITKKFSVAIRAVVTTDFMTALSAVPGKDFSIDSLYRAVDEITEKFKDKIEFVLYDSTGKPPATVEWE